MDQTLGRPEFYLLYTMFFFATAGGLIATANLSQIAKSLHVSDAKVWGFAIVPLSRNPHLGLQRAVENCVGIRSRIGLGRENTMFLTFGSRSNAGRCLVTKIAGAPIAFLVLFSIHFSFLGRDLFVVFSHDRGYFRP